MNNFPSIIQAFQSDKHFKKRLVWIETFAPKEAIYKRLSPSLPEPLRQFLKNQGITALYEHQCEAITAIRQGKHLILTTPTASGKSLAFQLPILERFIQQPNSTALFLYPTKALTQDQWQSLKQIEKGSGIPIHAYVYDGDTPKEQREAIRRQARIILTNPYMLHYSITAHHGVWKRFLSRLQFVLLDESHHYRGVFGAHVAMVLRRLRILFRYYGVSPQFILVSATLANPKAFAAQLTGLSSDAFVCIQRSGAPQGKKYFILYNPYTKEANTLSTLQESEVLLKWLLKQGIQTLCFTRTRRAAELIYKRLKEALEEKEPELLNKIAVYRGGYMPQDRRRIEQQLKNGKISATIATNALELGIDIGSLDCVIMAGYPGTMLSTWQQAGRAGRKQQEAFIFLIAQEDMLDQFFMRHPKQFFQRPYEHAILAIHNPYILEKHLSCAAQESPLDEKTILTYFGEEGLRVAKEKLKLHAGRFFAKTSDPHRAFYFGGIGERQYKLYIQGKRECLETLDEIHAFSEAHPGAVYLHQGNTYVVKDLDLEQLTITAVQKETDYYTQALWDVSIENLRVKKEKVIKLLRCYWGNVKVSHRYWGYIKRLHAGTTLQEPLSLPEITFETQALWITFPAYLIEEFRKKALFLEEGLHGLEHALIGLMPFHVLCDRQDLGGLSIRFHPETYLPTVFIYDGHEGGIGLSEKAFEIIQKLLDLTYQLVHSCACLKGCPSCIYSPKCGNNNRYLDKRATLEVLAFVKDMLRSLQKSS